MSQDLNVELNDELDFKPREAVGDGHRRLEPLRHRLQVR